MIILYAFISIFIAWIWVDYYRLIDIYKKGSLIYFIAAFLFGCVSVLIVLLIKWHMMPPWGMNGAWFNDFLYCTFGIGAIEEFAKLSMFLLFALIFSKRLNQPVDYIAFISAVALGFAAVENTMYFNSYGPSIIRGRSILSTVGHMFDTSLIAYGIVRFKFKHGKNQIFGLVFFFFLASLAHGFYDFWLMYKGIRYGGWIFTVIYFLFTISIFSVILNNALNNSSFFTYKRIIDSAKVASRLLRYYVILYLIQFVIILVGRSMIAAMVDMLSSMLLNAGIIIITCVRLSRFKLIKGRWFPLKLELPFRVVNNDAGAIGGIQIKGDAFNETYINNFYEDYFEIVPYRSDSRFLEYTRKGFVTNKHFLKNNDAIYEARIYMDEIGSQYVTLFLKPRQTGTKLIQGEYPVVAILGIDNFETLQNPKMTIKNFSYKEFGIVRPVGAKFRDQ